jgi:hypothetical protein
MRASASLRMRTSITVELSAADRQHLAAINGPIRRARRRTGRRARWPKDDATHRAQAWPPALSVPLRPGSLGLPTQCGCIFAHRASVNTNRSIRSVNHTHRDRGNPDSRQTLA